MTREEFERLLSDWLDEPLRADLHDLMESACAESPELVALRDAWRRTHALTREPPAELRSVDWRAQRDSILAAIDVQTAAIMEPGTRELEDLIVLALPTAGIDWSAQRARIAARLDEYVASELRPGPLDNVLRETDPAIVNWRAERDRIAAATTRATRRLRMLRWTGFAAGISAAAAVFVFFMIGPPASWTSPSASDAFADVVVVAAFDSASPDATAETATFVVSAPAGPDLATADALDESEESSELFFTIEPAPILAAGG